MKITFIQAQEETLPEILQMMIDFNSIDKYPFDKEIGMQNLTEFIHDEKLGRIWTINIDKTIVGYIILTFGFSFEYKGRDAFIDEFFIKDEFRNKGIGQRAMEFIEEKSKELNINALHLEVEQHNKNGQKLYIKRGFKGNNRILLTKLISR